MYLRWTLQYLFLILASKSLISYLLECSGYHWSNFFWLRQASSSFLIGGAWWLTLSTEVCNSVGIQNMGVPDVTASGSIVLSTCLDSGVSQLHLTQGSSPSSTSSSSVRVNDRSMPEESKPGGKTRENQTPKCPNLFFFCIFKTIDVHFSIVVYRENPGKLWWS